MAGRASVEMVFEMPAELEELSKLAEAVEGFVEENGLPAKLGFQLNLVLDELLTNTISYGCADGAQCRLEVRLRLRGDKKKGEVVLVIEDDAAPFNPLDVPPPDLDKPLEEREVGGLGVHLVRATMDTIDYERDGGLNRLTLRKKLES